MRHIISFMPYPLNLLPHVSSNNVGHLELNECRYVLLVYQLMCLKFGSLQYTIGNVYYTPQNV